MAKNRVLSSKLISAPKTLLQAKVDQLVALFGSGSYAELESRSCLLIEQYPDSGLAWKVLGAALKMQGKDALSAMQKAAELLPSDAEVHNNLGVALKGNGQLVGALASYRRALELKPAYAEAHNNLGVALREIGQLDEAVASFRSALDINPHSAAAHNNLGNTLRDIGQLDEAVACFHCALKIKPDYAEAHSNLGVTLENMGEFDGAVTSLHRALGINPHLAEAHNSLGNVQQYMGQFDASVASYRRALEIKPNFADAHSNLIFTLDLADTAGMLDLFTERKRWDKVHAAPLWQEPIHANAPTPMRRLRIGYVSADFIEHSAPRVFGGMLTRYDRSQFDVFAYANSKGKDDRCTEVFKQNVTAWRDIVGMPDEAVAKMIREDGIDILVDLSGHSGGNRLLVFARKPAPIQITAWGYATGTGLRAMDVFFTDPVMVPPQDKQYFTEEIRYLPSVVGSFSLDPYPDVNELPALSSGIITFGSFNRLVKVSEATYRTWAEVLLAVPQSRLILKTAEFSDATTRERVVEHFKKAGVVAERIILQGGTPWYEHVQAYNQIDIALDPFPHGGGVTALEGLRMGVPAITLRWPTTVGRLSASIMTTVGLPDWIAETREEYVALAMQKAADLQSLAALRQRLRIIFMASVIGDQAAYARAVEQEYRALWREWCGRQEIAN